MEDKQDLVTNEQQAQATAPPMYAAPPPDYQAYAEYPGAVLQPPSVQAPLKPGQAVHGSPPQVIMMRHPQAPPRDYMVMAILVTVFCCLPFGIVGIIKASEAKDMYAIGNYQGAEMASQSAGKWSKAGLICGVVLASLCTALMIIWIAVAASIYDDDWD